MRTDHRRLPALTLNGAPIGTPCPTGTPTQHRDRHRPDAHANANRGFGHGNPDAYVPAVQSSGDKYAVAANDLHLVLAIPEGVSVVTYLIQDPGPRPAYRLAPGDPEPDYDYLVQPAASGTVNRWCSVPPGGLRHLLCAGHGNVCTGR
jgi:hypothetical protein